MKRIFIAINLPEQVKDELEKAKQEIIESFPEEVGKRVGKWARKENLHVTLLFIGSVKDEKVLEVLSRTKQAVNGSKPFVVELDKIVYGAVNRGVPRLIWAEIKHNKDLARLADKLGSKRFRGHITLARVRQWVFKQIEPEERPEIERELDLSFEVKSVDIMESALKRTGAEYKILESIKLT